MKRLEGRVAVVTGAGRGLGRCHALFLASQGAAVVVNDLGGDVSGAGADLTPAMQVVSEIERSGGRAVVSGHDVSDWSQARAIVELAIERFGDLHALVNNAGILRDAAFHKMDASMIDSVIDVHLKGALYVTQPAFRLMRQQGYGRIISTSSASGLFGNFGQASYGAAKAGLAGLTRVLSIEGAGHGIRANAIAPIASTRMTLDILGDLAAEVSPESVSPLVAFLAHEECSVNGHIYSVAGGRVARIFVAETHGVVLPENSAEAVRAHLSLIDQRDVDGYHPHEPSSLDYETTIIAEALADAPRNATHVRAPA